MEAQLRDMAAELGRDAGYHATTEHRELAWTRVRVGEDGREEHEHADLDVRLERPPDDPLTYLDVVVTHPEGEAWRRGAAAADGCAAEGAARAKHRRYPEELLLTGRLVPFSVEAYGRWGREALDFLRAAAADACARSPALAGLGADAPLGLLGRWYCRLSCALQKANAAAILQAGRIADGAGFEGPSGWEEDVDDLLRQAAAYAAAAGAEA